MTKNKVNIRIPLPADTGLHSEVMWAQPLGGRRYQLANIPFHAYNLHLGDIVHASASAGDCLPVYRFTEVGSGNQTMNELIYDNAILSVWWLPSVYLASGKVICEIAERSTEWTRTLLKSFLVF